MGKRSTAPVPAGSFPEQVAAAREAALRLLSQRERATSELRQRLRSKGHPPEAIEAALDRLAEVGLQSDHRFAERFAASAVGRGQSARRIQGALRAKGIDPELAAQAAAASPEEERERALELATRRARSMASADPTAVRRRIAGMLARRGFDPDVCREVAEAVAGRENLDPDSGPVVP